MTRAEQLESMMLNAASERPCDPRVHVCSPEDKRAARTLERRGVVIVHRTGNRCAGIFEWWVHGAFFRCTMCEGTGP